MGMTKQECNLKQVPCFFQLYRKCYVLYFKHWQLPLWSILFSSNFGKSAGKISAQPHTLIMYTFCYSNASHVRSLCERVIIYDSDVCIIICMGLRRNLSNLPAPPKHPSVFDVFTNCTRKSVLLRAFVRKVIKFSQTFAKCDPCL